VLGPIIRAESFRSLHVIGKTGCVTVLSHPNVTIIEPSNMRIRMRKRHIQSVLAAAAFALGVSPSFAVDITGAGATFPFPIYAKWAEAYKQKTGVGMNYQSIGSGAGIKQIESKTVDFGASDMPLKAGGLQKNGLEQFPAIIGGDLTG